MRERIYVHMCGMRKLLLIAALIVAPTVSLAADGFGMYASKPKVSSYVPTAADLETTWLSLNRRGGIVASGWQRTVAATTAAGFEPATCSIV